MDDRAPPHPKTNATADTPRTHQTTRPAHRGGAARRRVVVKGSLDAADELPHALGRPEAVRDDEQLHEVLPLVPLVLERDHRLLKRVDVIRVLERTRLNRSAFISPRNHCALAVSSGSCGRSTGVSLPLSVYYALDDACAMQPTSCSLNSLK